MIPKLCPTIGCRRYRKPGEFICPACWRSLTREMQREWANVSMNVKVGSEEWQETFDRLVFEAEQAVKARLAAVGQRDAKAG